MEILNKNVALLSNYEVYDLLKRTKEDQTLKSIKKKKLDPNSANLSAVVDKHLPTIVYESLKYLEKSPCANQTSHIVSDFLTKLEEKKDEFKLTKIEKLQLLNLRPNNAVELQAIIDDSEERFSIEQMDSLLEFVQENLPIESDGQDENLVDMSQENLNSNDNN
jgi:hypothetical protein